MNTDQLLEEFEATLQVTEENVRHSIVASKFAQGGIIYQLSQELGTTEALDTLKRTFKVGERSLYWTLSFYNYVLDNYDGSLEDFMVGEEHSTSWTRIRRHILSAPKDEKQSDPRDKGYKLADSHIKKEGLPYAKEYVGGYSEKITDAQD